ncbi:MAG: hypothetical protein JST00_44250 [Deltaproteobacteria bacterium]|nr:hypothetical protein [Deltaproteobacteria bacterium]
MNWSKTTNKVIRNVTRAMPKALAGVSIPFVARKRTSVLPYVLGAIGVAIAGGIAAVMIMSPRARHRALDVAKDGYGKVKGQAIGITEKIGLAHGDTEKQAYSNGLSPESSRQGSTYSTSGL